MLKKTLKRIGKKAEGANWYMIGAIIFVVIIIVLVMILRKQASNQEGLIAGIFG